MKTNKKSFILYIDTLEVLNELTDEQAGQLFKTIHKYQLGEDTKMIGLMNAVFINFKNNFRRDNEKYNNICDRNKVNGSKGGRPKKITQDNPNNPMGILGTQDNPNNLDSDNDNDNDSDNTKEIVKEKRKLFSPPTQEEANSYFLEKGSTEIEAEKFVDFYQSKGWLVGKTKMKDWKAAVRNWLRKSDTTKIAKTGLSDSMKAVVMIEAAKEQRRQKKEQEIADVLSEMKKNY